MISALTYLVLIPFLTAITVVWIFVFSLIMFDIFGRLDREAASKQSYRKVVTTIALYAYHQYKWESYIKKDMWKAIGIVTVVIHILFVYILGIVTLF